MVLLHQRWRRVLSFAVAIALIFWIIAGGAVPFTTAFSSTATVAKAQTLEELRQQRDQLDKQLDVHSETDERYQRAEKQTDQQLRQLSKTIQGTDAWITDTEYQLAQAEQRLNQLETDLERNQQTYEEARSAVVGRLQFMQRQQGAQGWALLLQSQNLNEFLARRYRLNQVYVADRAARGRRAAKDFHLAPASAANG